MELPDGAVESLIAEDLEGIAARFEQMYEDCVANVKKPNVLVAGVTGCGKSSLINAIFGGRFASVGVAIPLTQHYALFSPPDKPVAVYDSKGLESGRHEEFIDATRTFVSTLRAKPNLAEHIHVVWYVVNAASGRIEPFELTLLRDIFAPIPVLVVLSKADIATAEQLQSIRQILQATELPSCKGVFVTVSDRRNYAQNWCTNCFSDDIAYINSTQTLMCEACGASTTITRHFGLAALIDATAGYLPDLAKEAFLNAQEASLIEKDKHAKQLVKQCARELSMDVSGAALNAIGEMIVRIFLLWGYNFLGKKVSTAVLQEMNQEYLGQQFSLRLLMIAADTMLKHKLSRSAIACLAITINKPLRQMSAQLVKFLDGNGAIDPALFQLTNEPPPDYDKFMKIAFERGMDAAIDAFW